MGGVGLRKGVACGGGTSSGAWLKKAGYLLGGARPRSWRALTSGENVTELSGDGCKARVSFGGWGKGRGGEVEVGRA